MKYQDEMKQYIIRAMDLELLELETYIGYNGSAILKLVFGSFKSMEYMLAFCENNGKFDVNSKPLSTYQYVCWIPFDIPDTYELKI